MNEQRVRKSSTISVKSKVNFKVHNPEDRILIFLKTTTGENCASKKIDLHGNCLLNGTKKSLICINRNACFEKSNMPETYITNKENLFLTES